MCGRFNFTDEQNEEIKAMLREINDRLYGGAVRTGEVFPTNRAAVLLQDGVHPMTWGFPHFKGNGVMINARCETVTEKKMFRDSVLERRCVIPSTGFFEWGAEDSGQQSLFDAPVKAKSGKTKYLFSLPGQPVLYMAGFYRQYDGEEIPRFVILTTAANASMEAVHDRMPVILRPEEKDIWLSDHPDFDRFFNRQDVLLERVPA